MSIRHRCNPVVIAIFWRIPTPPEQHVEEACAPMTDPEDKKTGSPDDTSRRRPRRGVTIKAAAVTAGATAAFASLSLGTNADAIIAGPAADGVTAAPATAAATNATLSTIAGQGSNPWGAPAAGVSIQADDRVATDPAGNIYVSSQYDGQVGKIASPAMWSSVPVNQMTTTPTFGGPYPAQAGSKLTYSRVDGQYAMTWAGPTMGPSAEVGVQPWPSVTVGTTYTASVTLVGSGQVQFAADTVKSGVITLSSTPQTISLTIKPTGSSAVFQLWTPSGVTQSNFTVTAYGFLLGVSRVTGATTLVAGNGNIGYSGDGGPATQATLDFPGGVAADARGDVYIADRVANVVRKVAPNGTITTVAGTGRPGYSGDGHAATSARLNFPGDVAVDAAGDLYIADTDNNAIRKVTPNRVITTVAGGRKGSLSLPEGVAADSRGDVFITDTANSRVEELKTDGSLVTVAGTGTPGFSGDGGPADQAQLADPFGVAVDAAGNVYIADTENNRIREVSPDGTISTLVGDGKAANRTGALSQAEIAEPFTVAVDNTTGDVYAAGSGADIKQISGLPVPVPPAS
jgi:NHL repeat-containing protein